MIWKIANKPNNFYILMKYLKDDYKLYDPTGKSLNVVSDDPLELDIREFLSTELEIEVTKAEGGREKVYEDETITIIKYENSKEGANALSEDASGTCWCIQNYAHALDYVPANFHIVFKNNEPIFAYHYPKNILVIWDLKNSWIDATQEVEKESHIKAIRLLQMLGIEQAYKFDITSPPKVYIQLLENPGRKVTQEQLNELSDKYIVNLILNHAQLVDHFVDKIPTLDKEQLARFLRKKDDSFDLSRINLKKIDLIGANLSKGKLSNADLRESKLDDADLSEANLNNANLSGACMNRANLFGISLWGAKLRGTDLSEANLIAASLFEADLRDANLHSATLYNVTLHNANLSSAILTNAKLNNASLGEANLSHARLGGADLRLAYLKRANLNKAFLQKSVLEDSTLVEAKLHNADLSGADLRKACLYLADLYGADLSGADLSKADLTRANLTNADLTGANLIGAKLIDTILTNTILPEGYTKE